MKFKFVFYVPEQFSKSYKMKCLVNWMFAKLWCLKFLKHREVLSYFKKCISKLKSLRSYSIDNYQRTSDIFFLPNIFLLLLGALIKNSKFSSKDERILIEKYSILDTNTECISQLSVTLTNTWGESTLNRKCYFYLVFKVSVPRQHIMLETLGKRNYLPHSSQKVKRKERLAPQYHLWS